MLVGNPGKRAYFPCKISAEKAGTPTLQLGMLCSPLTTVASCSFTTLQQCIAPWKRPGYGMLLSFNLQQERQRMFL